MATIDLNDPIVVNDLFTSAKIILPDIIEQIIEREFKRIPEYNEVDLIKLFKSAKINIKKILTIFGLNKEQEKELNNNLSKYLNDYKTILKEKTIIELNLFNKIRLNLSFISTLFYTGIIADKVDNIIQKVISKPIKKKEGILISKFVHDHWNEGGKLLLKNYYSEYNIKHQLNIFTDNNFSIALKIDSNKFQENFWESIKQINKPKNKLYFLAVCKKMTEFETRKLNNVKINDIIRLITKRKKIKAEEQKEFIDFCFTFNNIYFPILVNKIKKYNIKKYEGSKDEKYIFVYPLKVNGTTLRKTRSGGSKIVAVDLEVNIDPWGVSNAIPYSILELDGNQKETIDLAFEIWRIRNQSFNQPNGNEITYSRLEWIVKAGLTKTDQSNKTMANKYLLKSFETLKKIGLISEFTRNISLNDDFKIKIKLPDIDIKTGNYKKSLN